MIASAMRSDPSRITSIRQWASFPVLFALGVILTLMIDAALHGSTAYMAKVSGLTFLFGILWFAAYNTRLRWPRITSFIRFMTPILLYGIMYGDIHHMITAARPSAQYLIDDRLLAIDTIMFGVNPIAWLGNIYTPVLTDILYLSYFSYYFGMPVLMILMWRNSEESDFRRALSAMMIGWYGALITYTLFPALGPNRWMPEMLPQLVGALPTTHWIQGFLDMNLDPAVRDCIPSMHTGVTLLTLTYAFKYQRRFFWIFLLPGLGIIAATMYIQAHYVIDVMLGIVAAFTIFTLVEKYKPQ
jgi:hypothetical protein